MKKIFCFFLCVSVLISLFAVSVFAALPSGSSTTFVTPGSLSIVSISSDVASSSPISGSFISGSWSYDSFQGFSHYVAANTTKTLSPSSVYLISFRGEYNLTIGFSGGDQAYAPSGQVSKYSFLLASGITSVRPGSGGDCYVDELTFVPPNPLEAFVDGVSDFGKILISGGELSDGTEVDSIWASIIGFIMDNTICLIPVAAFLLILAFGSIRKWYKG